MIQTIGFIIVLYAGIRLLQVPIEFTKGQEMVLGTSYTMRLIVIAALSGGGLFFLAILTLLLLASGLDSPRL